MKVYVDNTSETLTFVQSIASTSTLISSLAAEARQYILSKFPKDYFKHVYIETSETVSQQNYNNHYNKNANKIPYPSLSISPEISLDDPIAGLEKSMHLSSPNLYLRNDINRTYSKILVDPDEEYAIYYTSDYITTNFNFKIITNSFIRNTDIAFYLKSKFQTGFFQYLNGKYLSSEIPKTFIKVVADIKDFDLNNDNDMTSLELYLKGSTVNNQDIEKRKNMSTGKTCFFLNKRSNLLTLFTDLDCPSSVARDSQVESEYIITFRLQVSTWLPNNFIMKFNKNNSKRLSEATYKALVDGANDLENGFLTSSIIPTVGEDDNYTKIIQTTDGVIGKKDVIYFIDGSGVEQIGQLRFDSGVLTRNIDNPLRVYKTLDEMTKKYGKEYKEFTKVLSYINDNNLDISSLLYFNIRCRDGELSKSNYEINPKSLEITFYTSIDSDMKILIYVNKLLYNSVLKALESDKNYFKDNYLTSVFANIAGNLEKLKVKSFTNEAEYTSSDLNKSLRVYTPYGTGYISLLDEKENSQKDNYKICVGKLKNGEPIIKVLDINK